MTMVLHMTVFVREEEPWISHVVRSIVTRAGRPLLLTQAMDLVGSGRVVVDGEIVDRMATVVPTGRRRFIIDGRRYAVDLREMEAL